MDIKIKNYKPQFLQEGGPIEEQPVELAPAAPEQGGGDIVTAIQQALETQDCNLAMQILQALMEQMGAGAPPAEPQGEPVYRRGGQLVKRIKK